MLQCTSNPIKNQTESQGKMHTNSKESLKSIVEEETGQPHQHFDSRASTYGGKRSSVFIMTKFSKRAYTTDAHSLEELCSRTKEFCMM